LANEVCVPRRRDVVKHDVSARFTKRASAHRADQSFARSARFYRVTAAVSFMVYVRSARSAARRVLEADRIGDEEECRFRDHVLPVHPKTVQSETRSGLLGHFVVTDGRPPAA